MGNNCEVFGDITQYCPQNISLRKKQSHHDKSPPTSELLNLRGWKAMVKTLHLKEKLK